MAGSKAVSTKGVKICVVKGSATGTVITGGATITNAKPAVLTGTGMAVPNVGDIIVITGTGNAKIDGKTLVVGPAPSATSITLTGVDLSGAAGAITVGAGVTVTHYAESTDDVCLCLNSFEISREAPTTSSVATFCDPTASLSSVVTQAGTVSIGGYVDINGDDFKEILLADEDAKSRRFRITLPQNGYIVFDGAVSGFSYAIPLDGAQAWTAQITLAGAPKHYF